MQLATYQDNKPWVCTVYFVNDNDLNIYWLSFPSRRHSKDITINNTVAATLVIKPTRPVVGLSVEGQASVVENSDTVKSVMDKYVAKYQEGKEFYNNFISNNNKHYLYMLKPTQFTLFDELSNKEKPCQKFTMTSGR